jgi:hypothetical protein
MNFFKTAAILIRANPSVAVSIGLGGMVVIIHLIVLLVWVKRGVGGEKKRKVRQPVVDRVTGKDPVQNARRFAEVADGNARHFKRCHHISWWLQNIAGILVTLLAGYAPTFVIQIFSMISILVPNADKFFGWLEAWQSARITSQLLSELIMSWDEENFRPDLSDVERAREFAVQARKILGGDRERFLSTAAKQVLSSDKVGSEPAKKE